MQKVIFLDIDGVLCNLEQWKTHLPDNEHPFDPICVERLNRIIEKTGAEIVISSSWRRNNIDWIRKIFITRGFKYPEKIIGETVRKYKFVIKGSHLPLVRGNEIKEYVDRHLKYPWHAYPESKENFEIKDEAGNFKSMDSNKEWKNYRYIILDDASDMLYEQSYNFIHTHGFKGLSEDDTNIAIETLNGNQKAMQEYLIKRVLTKGNPF